MHPYTFDQIMALRTTRHLSIFERDAVIAELIDAQHFHVSDGLALVADKLSDEIRCAADDWSKVYIPESSRAPGSHVVVTFRQPETGMMCFLVEQDQTGAYIAIIGDGQAAAIGRFKAGSTGIWITNNLISAEGRGVWALALLFIAAFFSLINEPRLVQTADVEHSRQQRRAMEKKLERPAVGYRLVSWTVGQPVIAKVAGKKTEIRMPLHWCRGHWRRESHQSSRAKWLEGPGRSAGWYVWVRDCWKGHPDFGIRLQTHSPLVAGEQRKAGSVVQAKGASNAHFAVMAKQAEAAKRAAGFAV